MTNKLSTRAHDIISHIIVCLVVINIIIVFRHIIVLSPRFVRKANRSAVQSWHGEHITLDKCRQISFGSINKHRSIISLSINDGATIANTACRRQIFSIRDSLCFSVRVPSKDNLQNYCKRSTFYLTLARM